MSCKLRFKCVVIFVKGNVIAQLPEKTSYTQIFYNCYREFLCHLIFIPAFLDCSVKLFPLGTRQFSYSMTSRSICACLVPNFLPLLDVIVKILLEILSILIVCHGSFHFHDSTTSVYYKEYVTKISSIIYSTTVSFVVILLLFSNFTISVVFINSVVLVFANQSSFSLVVSTWYISCIPVNFPRNIYSQLKLSKVYNFITL